MPSYPCQWPTCTAYVATYGASCPEHESAGRKARAERHRFYDQHQRNPEAKSFYNSAAWQHARKAKLTNDPVCERCEREWANTVHHVKPLKKCSPADRVAQDNLRSLCGPCHSELEAEIAANER